MGGWRDSRLRREQRELLTGTLLAVDWLDTVRLESEVAADILLESAENPLQEALVEAWVHRNMKGIALMVQLKCSGYLEGDALDRFSAMVKGRKAKRGDNTIIESNITIVHEGSSFTDRALLKGFDEVTGECLFWITQPHRDLMRYFAGLGKYPR